MIPAYRHFPTTLRAFSLLMAALAMLFASTAALAQTMASSVSQHGITWEFDREYEVGQFITGDYWVIGPVTITYITRPNNNPERDGSMVNPMPGRDQGYNSLGNSENYKPELNVANQLPLTLSAGSSLVSMISKDDSERRPHNLHAAVLTVLDSVPSATAFRPPYSGTRKPIHVWEDVDLSPLLNLPVVDGTNISGMKSRVAKPWIHHFTDWRGVQHSPPDANNPGYGRDFASRSHDVALTLQLEMSPEDKEEMARGYIQLGIDTHENAMNGMALANIGGGLGVGQKLSGILAGVLLNNDEMKNFAINNDPRDHFQEDAQIHLLTEETRDMATDGYWDDVPLGTPVWSARSIEYYYDRSWDDPPGRINYMACCTSNATVGAALVVRLMGIQHLWNNDNFLDWMDLYQGYPTDEFFDKQTRSEDWHFFWNRPFVREMWREYRQIADVSRLSPPSAPEARVD